MENGKVAVQDLNQIELYGTCCKKAVTKIQHLEDLRADALISVGWVTRKFSLS